jgi:hypothetical protein
VDEREGFAPVPQVNQFKRQILPIQCPIEKEDIGAVIFNHKDAGGATNRSVFQSSLPSGEPWAAPLKSFHS